MTACPTCAALSALKGKRQILTMHVENAEEAAAAAEAGMDMFTFEIDHRIEGVRAAAPGVFIQAGYDQGYMASEEIAIREGSRAMERGVDCIYFAGSLRDFARMIPDDRVALVTSRIFLEQPNSKRTFLDMADRIPNVVRLICPLLRLDSVVFGCTSATSYIGEQTVKDIIQAVRPGVHVTNPGTGSIAALRALGARRVSIITPYTVPNTQSVVRMLTSGGFETTQVSCFGFDTDMGIGSVPRDAYLEQAKRTKHGDADAIFVSCTATKALDAIEDIENATGLPCVTSNQASFWHAMRLAGWNEPIQGYGKLMKECW